MTKIIALMMIMVFGISFGQTERYIYQTEANPDTINLVDMKVERTFLDVSRTKSMFTSESKLLRDSLRSVKLQEKSNLNRSKKDKSVFPKLANGKVIQPTFFDYFILKDINNNTVNLVENVGAKQIYYQEDRKINWQILPDTSDFKGYKIQKAVVSFGGRQWTAWFAPDIKISDGPYKFCGLPGLILKLEDDRGDYRFSFVQKIIIPNAFQEEIAADARKSTRINFNGDKASVKMEFSKSKDSEINFDSFNPGGGRGMHQRNDMMNGGNRGMSNREMGSAHNISGLPRDSLNQNVNSINIGNTNPIEINNK